MPHREFGDFGNPRDFGPIRGSKFLGFTAGGPGVWGRGLGRRRVDRVRVWRAWGCRA